MAEWRSTQGLTVRQLVDIPPVWLMGAIGLVWLSPGGAVPFAVTLLGGVLFWAGLALIGWTILVFRSHATSVVPHQTPQRIITSGPFRYSRNPIYLADLMILAGVTMAHGAWIGILLVPLLFAILSRRFIASEEARMKQSFGAEFDAYAQKTRRWL